MVETVFGDSCFSKEATDLYGQVSSQGQACQHLAILESHSPATQLHCKGVAQMVAEYATSGIVELNKDQQERLVRVALLHDLGKLSISNTILEKPEKLSDVEWIEVRNHSTDGYHRYAISYDGVEALPILLHHTLQERAYPDLNDQLRAVSIQNVDPRILKEDETITSTVLVSLADHFEARYPIVDVNHPFGGTRTYRRREYALNELPNMVRSSFIEPCIIQDYGMMNLMNKIIECSREIILKK